MTSIDTIRRAVELSHKILNEFIDTSDRDRVPHIAVAEPLEIQASDRIVVTAWFCPGTIKNLAGKTSYQSPFGNLPMTPDSRLPVWLTGYQRAP